LALRQGVAVAVALGEGVAVAGAAGVAAAAITHGAHEREALVQCQPLVMVNNLQELRDWLLPDS
jgi:phosphoglycolate phosphatase-like HAD superfamily hydrolase